MLIWHVNLQWWATVPESRMSSSLDKTRWLTNQSSWNDNQHLDAMQIRTSKSCESYSKTSGLAMASDDTSILSVTSVKMSECLVHWSIVIAIEVSRKFVLVSTLDRYLIWDIIFTRGDFLKLKKLVVKYKSHNTMEELASTYAFSLKWGRFGLLILNFGWRAERRKAGIQATIRYLL